MKTTTTINHQVVTLQERGRAMVGSYLRLKTAIESFRETFVQS